MKRAIHFGAGKIGRGFIGALLSQAGYEVCFAEADPQLVDEINRRRGYTVHVTDEICAELRIAGVSAVRADSGEAVRRLVDADLVTTAVGLGVLPRVAPVIAAGLRARKAAGVAAPLNVVACENGVRATSRLKASVYEALDAPTAAWAERTVGFADCSVDRIVPPVAFPEPLDVAAEAFHEWNVERSAWVGEPPQLSGMHLTDELEAHIERKLFTLNTGHCATAYLGHLKGYVTIAEALADERIFGLVRGAMRQSGEALIRKFGFSEEERKKPLSEFSGGQQTKIAFIKLLLSKPDILLLDEPTNHLDVEAKEELKRALAAYKGNILLICHEPDFYEGFATKVWDCSEWSLKI